MAGGTSYNGWPASDSPAAIGVAKFGDAKGFPFPGGVKSGDVFTVLGYVCTQLHYRVEPCTNGWCWGYSYRANVNNPSTLSCHASATAIDWNAPDHPNGARNTFTSKQVGVIRQILAEVKGAVQWGGDYTGTVDEMHFEIIVSAAALAPIAASLPQSGGSTDMPLNAADLDAIKNVVNERINAHFGAGAVTDPGAALNAGLSPRLHADRVADLAANPR